MSGAFSLHKMREISERELGLPEAMIGELIKIASERKDIISLGPGEPDFTTPQPILDYASKIIKKATHYTASSGKTELKEAIAKKLQKENKIKADKENILVACGSQEAIFVALLDTIDPSEQVVIPNPGYLGYLPAIRLVNGHPVFVKLKEEDNFEINPDAVRDAIDKKKTNVLILNSPANPTGNVMSKKVMEEIADIAVENDIYIFSDEAYEKLTYDGAKHISIGALNGMEDYVITFQSFSKSYAMPGFRLGYACGPKEVIKSMEKVADYVTICPPNISQWLGIKALSLPQSHVQKMVREYDRRRKFIVRRLNDIGLRTTNPKGAFYTFSSISEVSKMKSLDFARALLREKKVAVVPGTEFGKYGEGYIRCSYATKLDLIKKAMEKVEGFVNKK